MKFTGSNIRFFSSNLFGVDFAQYARMFDLRDTQEEREKFLEHCKLYKYYCDQNLKNS